MYGAQVAIVLISIYEVCGVASHVAGFAQLELGSHLGYCCVISCGIVWCSHIRRLALRMVAVCFLITMCFWNRLRITALDLFFVCSLVCAASLLICSKRQFLHVPYFLIHIACRGVVTACELTFCLFSKRHRLGHVVFLCF